MPWLYPNYPSRRSEKVVIDEREETVHVISRAEDCIDKDIAACGETVCSRVVRGHVYHRINVGLIMFKLVDKNPAVVWKTYKWDA